MSVVISINGEDKTNAVVWSSLRIENILTKQVDRCTFTIRNPSLSGASYTPRQGYQVIITDNATRVFGGMILRSVEKSPIQGIIEYEIECVDFTRILDQKLVAETYSDMTVNEIISDIITNYTTDITMVQVDCNVSVNTIQFKYEPVSECIRQLAELVGYDWYVDYYQDLYFKAPDAVLAPFDIEDDNGSHQTGSLVIRRDDTQKRNSVYVRGGEYIGTQFTAEMEADGSQVVFNLPYKYKDFEATLSTTPLNIGIDYIHSADDYDALYNFQEKILRFKDADKPSQGAVLRYAGKPYRPVIVKFRDTINIADTLAEENIGAGEYQFLIIDKSISSQVEARQRAAAEIVTYGETLSEGEFVTETSGLRAGQRIRINSTLRNIDEYFVINRVISKMLNPSTLYYEVSLVTTKTMDFINLMKKFLLRDNKAILTLDTEQLDLVDSALDTINVATTTTVHPVNYKVRFVLGPWTPPTNDGRRQFIIEGSTFTA